MPRTLDNHLAGVSANAPHPESYRPDLPLLLVEDAAGEARFDEGYKEGLDAGKEEAEKHLYDEGHREGYDEGYDEGERVTVARVQRQVGAPPERPNA